MYKITYQFNDGTINEIEVNEKIYLLEQWLSKCETLNERRETRRHISYDYLLERGYDFTSKTINPIAFAIKREERNKFNKAVRSLSNDQQMLIKNIFFKDRRMTDIAKEEGVGKSAIANRLTRIYAKLEKLLN